jgi:hypothetical protein
VLRPQQRSLLDGGACDRPDGAPLLPSWQPLSCSPWAGSLSDHVWDAGHSIGVSPDADHDG